MALNEQQLRDAFVAPGHISEEMFIAIKEKSQQQNRTVEEVLIEDAQLKPTNVGRGIADAYGVPYGNLGEQSVPSEVLHLLPESVARAQQTVFCKASKEEVVVATAHPDNESFLNTLIQKMARPVQVRYALPSEIEHTLRGYQGNLENRIAQIMNQESDDQDAKTRQGVELVNLILTYAYDAESSDIHLEPLTEEAVVRLRIDGLLKIVTRYSKDIHEKIVARIKILAGLRTDEHAAPQDGRFTFNAGAGRTFDLRVSIAPITDGENVVLRILRRDVHTMDLEDIGLLEENLELLRTTAQRAHGMVLAVGPTGAGKTTTLYTLLKTIDTQERNVMTIEDPIEYNINYVQQMQVNPVKDVRFATGLRTIVRQDPDVILVGEIRDQETADIAINAAMTGHLLFSTLHANDAATTFPRLAEMGIEAFLVASSVNVVVAQRLMRKLCDACRKSVSLDEVTVDALNLTPEIRDELLRQSGKDTIADILLYKSPGCGACHNLGYHGRVGIFEVLQVTDTIRSLILHEAPATEIHAAAKSEGMRTMVSHGAEKVLSGLSDIDELIRVLRA